MKERSEDIDYIKGIMIFLVVCFHIHYVGDFSDGISYVTTFVYSFHIPVFFFYSGYLINQQRRIKDNLYSLYRYLFIPYAICEIAYIMCLFFVGKFGYSFSNKVENLNALFLLEKIFFEPIGAYWYLHNLIISLLVLYIVNFIFTKGTISNLIIVGILFYFISLSFNSFRFNSVIFLLLGWYFRVNDTKISPSFVSILAVLLIAYISLPDLKRGSIESFAITILIISFYKAVYNKLQQKFLSKGLVYIGKNTLIIMIVHPIFLNMYKVFLPFFKKVDSLGLLYIIAVTILTIISSLIVSYCLDKVKISKIVFGKNLYSPLNYYSV